LQEPIIVFDFSKSFYKLQVDALLHPTWPEWIGDQEWFASLTAKKTLVVSTNGLEWNLGLGPFRHAGMVPTGSRGGSTWAPAPQQERNSISAKRKLITSSLSHASSSQTTPALASPNAWSQIKRTGPVVAIGCRRWKLNRLILI